MHLKINHHIRWFSTRNQKESQVNHNTLRFSTSNWKVSQIILNKDPQNGQVNMSQHDIINDQSNTSVPSWQLESNIGTTN